MSIINMTLAELAEAVGGELHGDGAISFCGVSTDTRTIEAGQLFVALQGPNFDGSRFVAQAGHAGAVAAIVNGKVDDDLAQIVVTDTRVALGQLAAHWRNGFSKPVIGVTGSNGKTTVKEMLASIMAQQGPVWATQGNLNNDIGVPLTLFQLDSERYQSAVIEMGANHVGEISYLTALAKPSVALVTNAGAAHVGEFGSMEAIAQAKGEIWQGLPENGVAVINADDTFSGYWRSLVEGRPQMTFGLSQGADVHPVPDSVKWSLAQDQLGLQFEMVTPLGEATVTLQLAGGHNIVNALAATTAAIAAGVDLEHICAGLAAVKPVKGRLQPRLSSGGQLVIDDSYNANPQSLSAAIDVLVNMAGEKIAVLGDMAELGDASERLHFQAGEQARQRGITRLYATGAHSRETVRAFGDNGFWFESRAALTDELLDYVADAAQAGQVILVKGSRSARMDEVVDKLVCDAEVGGVDESGSASGGASQC